MKSRPGSGGIKRTEIVEDGTAEGRGGRRRKEVEEGERGEEWRDEGRRGRRRGSPGRGGGRCIWRSVTLA
jgi:hypothetical protein